MISRADGLTQQDMPLVTALRQAAMRDQAAFYAPGHKRGQGMAPALQAWWGRAVLQADLPELPELDNLFAPEGAIYAAQSLAAELFGAEQTWFLANGSTCGLEAAILATCAPGEILILSRNVHRSAISGLVLSGAQPVFVQPDYCPEWELALGLRPEDVALALEQYPQARAVLIVSPTYQGICADVAAIATLAHQRGLPLIVDEAHGAHFGHHPDLPASALAQGADLVVQSTHKVLGALTQASMLHVQGTRIDRQRLSQALQLTQSTSPNALLLASLDAARHQLAAGTTDGRDHASPHPLQFTIDLAQAIHYRLTPIPGLRVLNPTSIAPSPGLHALDPTRLTLDLGGWGMTGFELDDRLNTTYRVIAELPTLRHLTFILSLGNTIEDGDRLIHALQTIAATLSPVPQPPASLPPSSPSPLPITLPPPISPRDAFFAQAMTLPLDQAIDHVSRELICPYPPGIPLLLPGERITADAIATLRQIQGSGGIITGCQDPSLSTLQVLA